MMVGRFLVINVYKGVVVNNVITFVLEYYLGNRAITIDHTIKILPFNFSVVIAHHELLIFSGLEKNSLPVMAYKGSFIMYTEASYLLFSFYIQQSYSFFKYWVHGVLEVTQKYIKRWMDEWMMKWLWHILKKCSIICPEGLRETIKNIVPLFY